MIFLNGLKVETSKFPNKETLIKGLDVFIENNIHHASGLAYIILKYEDDSDLTNLIFLKKHLDDEGIKDIVLDIPYFPYSRMDRAEEDVIFTLKHVASLINWLNFSCVVISEPHSNVVTALLDRVQVMETSIHIANIVMHDINFDKEKDYLYFPDTTAEKRYAKHFKGCKYITGLKNRDFATGEITHLSLLGEIETKNPNIVMVDDLCCKGGTFLFGAKLLKEKYQINNIYLCVTHCENSVFEGKLFEGDLITKLFTTDSLLTKDLETDKLSIVEV